MQRHRLTAFRALAAIEAKTVRPLGILDGAPLAPLLGDVAAGLRVPSVDELLSHALRTDDGPQRRDNAETTRRPQTIPGLQRHERPISRQPLRPRSQVLADGPLLAPRRSLTDAAPQNSPVLNSPGLNFPALSSPGLNSPALNSPADGASAQQDQSAAPGPNASRPSHLRHVGPVMLERETDAPMSVAELRRRAEGKPTSRAARHAEPGMLQPRSVPEPRADSTNSGAGASAPDSGFTHEARTGRNGASFTSSPNAGSSIDVGRADTASEAASAPAAPSSLRDLAQTWHHEGPQHSSTAKPVVAAGFDLDGPAGFDPARLAGVANAAGEASHRHAAHLAGAEVEAEAKLLDLIERGLRSEARRYGLDLDGWLMP